MTSILLKLGKWSVLMNIQCVLEKDAYSTPVGAAVLQTLIRPFAR